MNIVIYARFSSHSQTEQSIEGQLKVCYEYARNNNYTVVGEYVDRAQSGTTDNRLAFQRMISDSDKHTFEGVLVYQLDRFARNRYDSAINKSKLKKNGVRVISAKENIADDPSGILVEGVLESMAEYYSAELSQKINRGMAINAEKCLSNGSNPGLGFKVDSERRFYVDEDEAKIVREIFERYAAGETKAEIVRDLQRRKIKTSIGKDFSTNSLSRLLSNKRYIGIYLYKNKETPGGMPRIIDDDLFYRVQEIIDRNKSVPARTRGENEYLLTTKLFCGHCKEMMVGYGGTSKSGQQYHYYACKNAKKKRCKKKIVSKKLIEDRVIAECLKLLTDENIAFIAKTVAEECNKSPDNISVKELKKAIKEADTAIENLWKGIELGQSVEMLTERINQRKAEKAELEEQLAIEQNKKIILTEPQIYAFLDYVCDMASDDINKRRAIINIFVHSVYLYDDYFTLIINASRKPLSIENIPLDEIESSFSGDSNTYKDCSLITDNVPGKVSITCTTSVGEIPSSNKCTFTVEPSASSYSVMSLGVTYDRMITLGRHYWFYFTPTETGVYTFESSGTTDTYGSLYMASAVLHSDDDDGVDNNFKLSYRLTANVRYRFLVKGYGDIKEGSCTVKVIKGWPETAKPSINPRSSWNARNVIEDRLSERTRAPERLIFHHSADKFDSTDYDDTVDEIQRIQDFHMDDEEKCDIAYHFIIDPAGRIWQGAEIDDYKRGHATNYYDDIGVLVLGDFESRAQNLWNPNILNQAQKNAMETLAKWLCYEYNLSINTSYQTAAPINTHRRVNPGGTVCPGDNAAEWIENDLQPAILNWRM